MEEFFRVELGWNPTRIEDSMIGLGASHGRRLRAAPPEYEVHFNLWLRTVDRLATVAPAWLVEDVADLCQSAYEERYMGHERFRGEDLAALTVAFQDGAEEYVRQVDRLGEKLGGRPEALKGAAVTAAKVYAAAVRDLFGVRQE